MKQKYKRVLTQALALGMTLVMTVQMLPTQALAVEYQTAQMDKEIEDLREEVADLEQQAEELLGYSLQDVLEEQTSSDSDADLWDPYETDEVSSAPVMVTSTDDVTAITEESAFTFDATTGTITGFTKPSGQFTVTIPSTIDDVAVTAIGENAFRSCSGMTGVTIPAGVITIGYSAFYYCTGLTAIEIPGTVTTLGEYAFSNCSGLTAIEIPNTVTNLGEYAFSYCSGLENVTIGSGITVLPAKMFYQCSSLETVNIKGNITEIGESAFYYCKSLAEIELPDGLTTIGANAFQNTQSLKSLTIPDSVTSIGGAAFRDCAATNFAALDLTGVTTLGSSAFLNTNVKSVKLPADMSDYGTGIFGGTPLETIEFAEGTEHIPGIFSQSTSLKTVVIPDTVTTMDDRVFEDCSALESVTLSNQLEEIPQYAFETCTSLASIHIPDSVTVIGSRAFDSCSSLVTVEGMKSVDTIEAYAFRLCSSLASIDISSATSLGSSAFLKCAALTSVTLNENAKFASSADSIFRESGLVEVVIPDSIYAIPQYCFYGCASLETVTANNLTSIGESAFQNCTSLIATPDLSAVWTIGKTAFYGCTALTQVDLYAVEDDLTLYSGILNGCTSLEKIVLHSSESYCATTLGNNERVAVSPFAGTPETVEFVFDVTKGSPTKIGDGLFSYAPFINGVEDFSFIPDTVVEYGDYAFAGCFFTEITVPEQIEAIGYACFSSCDSLVKVTILNDSSAWDLSYYDYYNGNYMDENGFFYKTKLSDHSDADTKVDITFPDSWTEIPDGFFAGSYIRDTEFLGKMKNLKTIGPYAFYYCTYLENLVIPEGVETIEHGAFKDSFSKVKVFTIPATVSSLPVSEEDDITWQFYHSLSSYALTDVYIYNPALNVYADTTDDTDTLIFNWSKHSTSNPLTIHGVVDENGNSTAKTLCEASGGKLVFEPIGAVGKITLAVMAGDKNIADAEGVIIEWKNSAGVVQGTGPVFQPYAASVEFAYTITLPEEMLDDYYIPEGGTVTSAAGAVTETVTLTAIPNAAFTVQAPEGAYVELTQKVNGREFDYESKVGSNGSVTFDAKQVYTEIAVSRDSYYSKFKVISEPETSNTVDLSADWRKLPATTVTLTATSTVGGVTTPVADLSDFTFTVKNSGGTVLASTVQGNLLVLDEAVDMDAQLTLEAESTGDLIAPAPIGFALADGAVTIPFTGRGYIRLDVQNYSINDPEGYYLWLFDTEGRLVDSYTMYYGFAQTDPLPESAYIAVAIDMSVGISSVPYLSALKTFGLTANTHYYQTSTSVANGAVTELNATVPDYAAFGGALYVDMFASAEFGTTAVEPTVGQNFFLWLDYQISDAYASTGEKQIVIQLPRGMVVNQCYTPEGTGTYTYDEDNALLTVKTKVNEGRVYLSVKGTDADSYASVVASAKLGAYTAKPVSFSLPLEDIRIEAYNVRNGDFDDRTVSVYTVPGAEVMLYVDGEPYKHPYAEGDGTDWPMTANKEGKAVFRVELTPAAGWELTATAKLPRDEYGEQLTIETEAPKPIYNYEDPFNVQISLPSRSQSDYHPAIRFNDYDNSDTWYWGVGTDWMYGASVNNGMQKYIKDGVIWLKFLRTKDDPRPRYLPLREYEEGSRFFSAHIPGLIYHSYIDYYFEVTDEFYTEYLGVSAPVEHDVSAETREFLSGEELAELQELTTSYRSELTEEELSQLTDEERAAELSFQAALSNLRLSFAEYIPEDLENASDEEVLEAMGITTRDLEPGELSDYAANKSFTPVELKNADGTISMQYTYADKTTSIVVDEAAGTVTTMDYTVMQQNAQTYVRKRASRSGTETAQSILQEASNTVSDVSKQVSNLESLIDAIENSLEEYKGGGLWDKIRKADAADFCGLAKKVLSKAITIFNFFEWGSMIGEGFSLNALSDAAMAEWEQIRQSGGEGLADPTECMKVLENLATAYGALATAIAYKVLYLTAQLVMVIGSIAAALPSGGVSILVSLLAMLATTVIDAAFDANIDRARQAVDQWLRKKSYACRPTRDETEDDAPCGWVIDPSGYVYEGVFSNRVEGLTVTTYYRDDGNAVKWDAENYEQENPLITDSEGYYRWDVPEGEWKVVVSENGDYNGVDTTDVYREDNMREGRADITADGWHTVLPVQTEVHIPVVSKHAPAVDGANTIAYSDGILVQFSQYMKEETVAGQITVTMGSQTFTGSQLAIAWPDLEYSDHYYDDDFASQLMISRADGQTWTNEVTVSIAGGQNYAGTALSTWTETMAVVPVIDEIRVDSSPVTMDWDETKSVTITLLDASDNPIKGIPVEFNTNGLAVFVDSEGNEWGFSDGVSNVSGQVTVSVTGKYPGNDTIVLSIPGRTERKSIPVQIGSADSRIVAEPVVTINGKDYSGQGHVIEVKEGTVVTVTGEDGDTLYYSIGENACPCEDDQIRIGTGSGAITITKSGYYKFAAYRDGQYSSRVHIDITLEDEEPAPDTYEPDVAQPANGSIAVSPAKPETGDTVTVMVTPNEGYETTGVTVTDSSGEPVAVTEQPNGTYTFTQPEGSVRITADIAAKHVHVYDQQKAESEYLVSEADCENPAVYYLSCGCGEAGTDTFTYGEPLGHTHRLEWKKDHTNHWHECSCGDKKDVAGHEYGDDTLCDVCGYQKSGGGSSGGGGGGSASATYTPAITQPENGSISVSPEKAEAGDTVTVIVTPDKGYTLETLTVTDRNGKEINITAKDGKFTFTMPSSKVTIQATFMEDNTMLNFFVDVPADAYYHDAVLWAVLNGITSGTTDTTFSPNATCTRAQAVTFLWRAAGSPNMEGDMVFADVTESAYYYDAVLWAVAEGITSGTTATTFSPNATCTRAQIGTFLWRSAGSPEVEGADMVFADVAHPAYYYDAVCWAVDEGITAGTTATTFTPDAGCTRAQIVTFLWRKSEK